MGGEDRGGLPELDPELSKSREGHPDPDPPTRPDPILSGFYPPRDISPIADS